MNGMMGEALQRKPFAFRRRFDLLTGVNLVASVNLDQIARDLDFEALQENLSNIAFCNIELELDLRLVDPNFVKLFRMGQLNVEYLLYSQDYLSETIISLESRIKEQNKNEENLMEKVRVLEKELERYKKEGHKRKKLIMEQQHLIEAGADNFHKCLLCPKAFMNSTFLQNHCVRRHGQTFQEIKSSQDPNKENEIPSKISEQLKEIKERLVYTESQLAEERKSLREMNAREASMLADRDAQHMNKMEEWQAMRESQHKQEIDRIQNMLMCELREMQEKQQATQKALDSAQMNARPSNLGTAIRDDLDVEREMLQRERDQLLKQQDSLQLKIEQMQEMVENQLIDQEAQRGGSSSPTRPGSGSQSAELQKIQKTLDKQQKDMEKMKHQHKRELKNKEKHIQELSSNPKSMTNGHRSPTDQSEVREEMIRNDRKKKTLTFAADPSARQQMSPERADVIDKVQVPDIREQPPTDQTLSSGDDSDADLNDDTTLADATSTAQSVMSTLGTGDLTMKSQQLRDAINQNPKLMQDMKQQLRQVFNNELLRWDVQPDSEGLTSSKLNTKSQHLAQERNKMERKYKMFRETRNALIKNVDQLAKESVSAVGRRNNTGARGATGRSTQDSKQLTGTMSSLTATMDSSTWGTSSSKWTSSDRKDRLSRLSMDDDDEEEDTSSDEETLPAYNSQSTAKSSPAHAPSVAPRTDSRTAPPTRQTQPEPQKRQSSGWQHADDDSGGFTPSKKPAASSASSAIKVPDMDLESDSDFSDIEEVGGAPVTLQTGGSNRSTVRASGVVGNIAANIESQLLGRKGKAPVGGINTLEIPDNDSRNSASPTTPDIPQMERDEEDFSISSVEAQLMAPSRNTAADTNTFSSKQWGQSSAQNSTLQSTGSKPGGDKASSIASDNASFTSVTGTAQKGDSGSDWSADSDFDNL